MIAYAPGRREAEGRRLAEIARDLGVAPADAARAEGLDVTADVYPYTASSTTLRTLLPGWALEGGVEAMLERLQDPAERAQIRSEVEAGKRGGGELGAERRRGGTQGASAPGPPGAGGRGRS